MSDHSVSALFGDSDLYKHASGLASVGALALKNQIKLRGVLLVGLAFSAVSHVVGQPHPAWTDLFWNTVSFAINIFVLTQLLLDRTHIGLTQEQERLFAAFKVVTPGEFRALVKLAHWKTAHAGETLTREGVKPDHLYYVLDGEVQITKGDRTFTVQPKVFIGEVAYLHGWAASATVTLGEGARYLVWDLGALQRGLDARSALRSAMMRLLGLDTAQKVADS